MAVVGGVAAAAGAVGSAVIGSDAASSAADTQAAAANNATQVQWNMFNKTQQNLQPYMQAGTNALSQLQNFLGLGGSGPSSLTGLGTSMYPSFSYDPNSDPLFNLEMQTGTNAILNNASALGGVNSGNTLRALQQYGQQTALNSYQQEFANYNQNFSNWNTQLNNIFSRLSGVTNTGANAAGGLAGIGSQTAQSVSSNIIGAGNAQAAGQIGTANAISGGLQSLFQNPSIMNSLASLGGSASGGGTYAFTTGLPTDYTSGYNALNGFGYGG